MDKLDKFSERPLFALIKAGGVNDMPVVVPAAAMSDTLIEAIKTVKAAGYRVTKTRLKQYRRKGKHKDRVGPTCVTEFADGVTVRMSTFTSLENLDWDRGEHLSIAAYQSRWRARHFKQTGILVDAVAPVPPAIVSMHFEQDGKVLAQRNGGGAR